jgi:hypothetical protein
LKHFLEEQAIFILNLVLALNHLLLLFEIGLQVSGLFGFQLSHVQRSLGPSQSLHMHDVLLDLLSFIDQAVLPD